MADIIVLIRAELAKLFIRTSTRVMMIILFAGVLAAALLHTNYSGLSNGKWEQNLVDQNTELRKLLQENPNMAGRVTGYYEQQIEMNEYRIDKQLPPSNAHDFMKEALNINKLVELLIVIIAASIIGSEFSSGTIKLLLIRPRSRLAIIISKWITSLIFFFVLMFVLFVCTVAVSSVKFGVGTTFSSMLAFEKGEVVLISAAGYLAKQFLLVSIQPIVIMTIAFMIATLSRGTAIATGVSLFISFSSTIITDLLSRFEWVKYFIFANTDFQQYESGQIYQSGMTAGFSILILCIYLFIFLGLTATHFCKKDILV